MTSTNKPQGVSRRLFLAGTGAAVSLAAGGLGATRAFAQSNQMIIGNWGGDWHNRIDRIFEQDFSKRHGVQLSHDFGTGPERRTKLLAERALPRGSMDVAWLTDQDAYDVQQHDLLVEPLDLERIPNHKHIYSSLHSPFYVPWVIAGYAILYNPNKITDPPNSFADLWDPRWAGRVGINDMNYYQSIMVSSLVETGELMQTDAGFEALKEMKESVQPRFYANHEHLAAGFASEEIWIATNYTARGHQWKKDGLPIEVAYPSEGMIVSSFGAGIPKRANNIDLAYAYINEMLAPDVMAKMAAESYYEIGRAHV